MSVCPKCGTHICSGCGAELAFRNWELGRCSRCQREDKKANKEADKRCIFYGGTGLDE